MPSIDTTILGGLPVTVEFSIEGPDESVGIFGCCVSDWYVTHINNRKCKNADWIYKRLDANPKEEERLRDKLNEYANDPHIDYFED